MVIIERAITYLQEWRDAAAIGTQRPQNPANRIQSWEKPQSGWTKLNVDAALDSSKCTMGFGWIIRDDEGNFVVAKCLNEPKEIFNQKKSKPWQYMKLSAGLNLTTWTKFILKQTHFLSYKVSIHKLIPLILISSSLTLRIFVIILMMLVFFWLGDQQTG